MIDPLLPITPAPAPAPAPAPVSDTGDRAPERQGKAFGDGRNPRDSPSDGDTADDLSDADAGVDVDIRSMGDTDGEGWDGDERRRPRGEQDGPENGHRIDIRA